LKLQAYFACQALGLRRIEKIPDDCQVPLIVPEIIVRAAQKLADALSAPYSVLVASAPVWWFGLGTFIGILKLLATGDL